MIHNLDIVPLYGFGENQIFTTHTLLGGLRRMIAKHLRVGLPLILPRLASTHVQHVFGRPIACGGRTTCNPPTDAEVEAIAELYAAELRRLFDEHAHKWLPPEVARQGLRVVRIGHGSLDPLDTRSIRSKL
eukprot:CAMPEP_0205916388 /NCGR_PEP_ID=MMETSP1325-20131115/8468_1 /ASSEMBLY_ACC=CAM_ASM_000708 /TAXON_ID=236786 /ORGANISM="Florenciella sp., Strain RCC1007" /LENGTH=130 /DNA_ID=CAMNT_0053283657 /DNA_START=47 /DNA_END=439 /DNA_ORIENTATION=+